MTKDLSSLIRQCYDLHAASIFVNLNDRGGGLIVLDERGEVLSPKDHIAFDILLELFAGAKHDFGGGETALRPYNPELESDLPWVESLQASA